MIPSTPSISPLRQRMLEDMRMRKLELRAQARCARRGPALGFWRWPGPDRCRLYPGCARIRREIGFEDFFQELVRKARSIVQLEC